MLRLRSTPSARSRILALAVGAAAVCVLAPSPARAHFVLHTPTNWMSQDSLGTPQKLAPCGNEGGGTATNAVTAYQPGDTVTITLDETIFHPGHYRVALSVNNRSELPPEPAVTAGSTACGSAAVENPPVFPVLGDGLLDHTAAFSGTQTIHVKLPTNVTCTHCTLQVLEFMSNHGAPCFYHHCADISIGAPPPDGGGGDASSSGDASSGGDGSVGDDASSGGDSGSSGDGGGNHGTSDSGSSGGCAFSASGDNTLAPAAIGALFGLVGLLRRRRR